MTFTLPDPSTPFGRRVHDRLRGEQVIWFTTVGQDGTPQPNPVWFVWTGDTEIVTYNLPDAHRVAHIAERPQVALHFNSDPAADEVIVARGLAERADELAPPHRSPEYLAKYRDAMTALSGDVETFAATYPTALRVRITGVRGY